MPTIDDRSLRDGAPGRTRHLGARKPSVAMAPKGPRTSVVRCTGSPGAAPLGSTHASSLGALGPGLRRGHRALHRKGRRCDDDGRDRRAGRHSGLRLHRLRSEDGAPRRVEPRRRRRIAEILAAEHRETDTIELTLTRWFAVISAENETRRAKSVALMPGCVNNLKLIADHPLGSTPRRVPDGSETEG